MTHTHSSKSIWSSLDHHQDLGNSGHLFQVVKVSRYWVTCSSLMTSSALNMVSIVHGCVWVMCMSGENYFKHLLFCNVNSWHELSIMIGEVLDFVCLDFFFQYILMCGLNKIKGRDKVHVSFYLREVSSSVSLAMSYINICLTVVLSCVIHIPWRNTSETVTSIEFLWICLKFSIIRLENHCIISLGTAVLLPLIY